MNIVFLLVEVAVLGNFDRLGGNILLALVVVETVRILLPSLYIDAKERVREFFGRQRVSIEGMVGDLNLIRLFKAAVALLAVPHRRNYINNNL